LLRRVLLQGRIKGHELIAHALDFRL
jgi:hypothetical protein